MVKNKEVVEGFVNHNDSIKTKHLFIEDNVLYFYGCHYPLSIRLDDGFIINNSGYSMTTATHTNILIRAVTTENNLKDLEKNKPNNIILMNIEQIKGFVGYVKELNLKTLIDVKNYMILNNL